MDSEFIKRIGKMLMCEMCGKKLATDQCAEDHIKGKKHRRLVSMKQSREEQSQRSIFIGNLRKTTSEPELLGHFSEYGPVSRVIIDKQKSSYAILEFVSPASALKATEEERQVMNGLHITVRPREVREFVASGIKQRNAALAKGKKKEEVMQQESEKLTLMLLGKISDQMDALMNATRLSDASLKLRYLICDLLREVFSEFFPNCRVYPYGSSVNGCGLEGSDLDLFLSLNWKDNDWKYRFASLTGETTATSKAAEPSTNQPPVDTVMDGDEEGGLPDPSLASGREALEFAADILRKCTPSCHKIQVIASARKPVVKFVHADSGLHCDILLNNRLSLRNTELVYLYCSLSPLVRPLVYLVRRWGKVHHISENVGPGPRLTNYALTWMVIFFLQTKRILPTVGDLRQKAEPADKLIIDGWDCSLCMDGAELIATKDAEPEQILKELFEYYADLDLATSCLCPATGTLTRVTDMLLLKHPSTEGTFKVGPVNIQDPLELTHNIAANVNEKTAKIISQVFTKAVDACRSDRFLKKLSKPEADCEETTTPWGIGLLVTSEQKAQPVAKSANSSGRYILDFEPKRAQISEGFASKFDNPQEMNEACLGRMEAFLLEILRDILAVSCTRFSDAAAGTRDSRSDISDNQTADSSMEVDDENGGENRSRLEAEPVTENVGAEGDDTNPFKRTSKISEAMAEPPPKKQRTAEPGTSDPDRKLLALKAVTSMYSCALYHDVWVGRRKARRTLQKERNDLQGLGLEKLVTERLILDAAGASKKKGDSIVEFSLEVRQDLEKGSVKLTTLPLKGVESFKLLHHFLEGFLSRSLDELKFQ